MTRIRVRARVLGPLLLLGLLALVPAVAQASGSYLGQFSKVTEITSTVPPNGDINPYGTAVVPRSVGNLTRGNVLISNFNNSGNLQGTGTTIVQVSPRGTLRLFARIKASNLPGPCPGGVGLTTALAVLSSGFVIVGSLPTSNGQAATAKAGCLIVLNAWGQVVRTISGGPINGPWDMTAVDYGNSAVLFVTNVLNGTVAGNGKVVDDGTVVRLTLAIGNVPYVTSATVIGSEFAERTDPNALVIGPTGVGLGFDGTLYVADSLNNRIAGIPNALYRGTSAGTGFTLTSGGSLNDPLGLTIAPNGDVLTVNGNDGNIVEATPRGTQVRTVTLIANGGGSLFGLAIVPGGRGVYFVNDGDNTLDLFS